MTDYTIMTYITNNYITLQSLFYTDGEAAADLIVVFGIYLRANIDSLESDKPLPFSMELEHIKQFISLEKAGADVDFKVIFDLRATGFMIPPLTVQPIAENAIKHGTLTRHDGTGKVIVKTEENDDGVTIRVNDNGIGADLTDIQKEHYNVGIENARKRFELLCKGTLDISFTEDGCIAVITLPKASRKTEADI